MDEGGESSGILTEFRCSLLVQPVVSELSFLEVGTTLGIRVVPLMRVALVKLMSSPARTAADVVVG